MIFGFRPSGRLVRLLSATPRTDTLDEGWVVLLPSGATTWVAASWIVGGLFEDSEG